MDEYHRRYYAGKYNTSTKTDPPKEKGKVLNEVEKKTKPGNDAGKLRDKSRKEIEELGL